MWLRRPISLADSRIMSFRGADAGTGAVPVFLAFHRHRVSLPVSSSSTKLPPRRRTSLSGCTVRLSYHNQALLDPTILHVAIIEFVRQRNLIIFSERMQRHARYSLSFRIESNDVNAKSKRPTRHVPFHVRLR